MATVFFAVQIYCDFSGYSTIAMGTARILGIDLMENFNAPYLSTSVAQFWRNWHISLTSWFKDYLYIPLGGNRKGKARKQINKMIVFLVSGLWHGAELSYVVWGGLNGLYQVLGEILAPVRNCIVKRLGLNRKSIAHRFMQILITFILVDFSWIFFRAGTIGDAIVIIKSIFTNGNAWVLFNGDLLKCGLDSKNMELIVLCIGLILFADYWRCRGIRIREVIIKQDGLARCVVIAVSVLLILIFGIYGPTYDAANFIYFQF